MAGVNPDLMSRFVSYAESLGWVERGCFIHKRGWSKTSDGWISPHTGEMFDDSILPMAMEMARESEIKSADGKQPELWQE